MPLSLAPLLFILTATLLTAASSQSATTYPNCSRAFSCGTIRNITYPFTGGDRPSHCGLPDLALSCRNSTITKLTQNSLTYRVLQLDQTQRTIVLSRSDLYNTICPSEFHSTTLNSTLFDYNGPQNEALTLFYGCNTSTMSIPPNNHFTCNNSIGLNFSDAFYLVGPVPSDPHLRIISCSMSIEIPILSNVSNQLTASQLSLEEALMQGFSVIYSDPYERFCLECRRLGGECGFDSVSGQPLCICEDRPCPFALKLSPDAPSPNATGSSEGSKRGLSDPAVRAVLGVSLGIVAIVISSIIIFCITKRCRSRAADLEINKKVDKFLLNHGSLAPKRYNYSGIKKITKSFTYKLGQGGFGIVYKGKLPDGQLVAVKVLTDTTDNGEEFINEVASISRTSHVNIVNLLAFCYERKIKALVYEFMPNKSLDKFIYQSVGSENYLEWEKLYKIAVGVARGLEYLHRGCNTRIVHFDIKPQNILLDDDFCPKIADFGLAKLGKEKQSMISMLGTRGTIGYIAPEVFSRNFGGVSHKSDVYSYGMMLLEMAGRRKNAVIEAIELSENYFPEQIYEHVLVKNEKLDDVMSEEKEEIARKMLLVGVWCIQTAPSERPSITKVVEMLEGSLRSIEIPPKPSLFSSKMSETQLSSSFSVTVEIESTTQG